MSDFQFLVAWLVGNYVCAGLGTVAIVLAIPHGVVAITAAIIFTVVIYIIFARKLAHWSD